MADHSAPEEQWAARLLARRIEKKGLRPRLAASLIATLWIIAIVVFGVAQHLIDPGSFGSVGEGMWWATQTVTTVGYGDVVPGDTAGRLIAGLLMIGGLSLFAVVTGVITSAFVARAQADRAAENADPLVERMTAIEERLTEVGAELARLSAPTDRPQSD
jgi:voltage-gated potassium channel